MVDDGGGPGVVGGYAGEEGVRAVPGGEGEVGGCDGEVRVGFCCEGVDDCVGTYKDTCKLYRIVKSRQFTNRHRRQRGPSRGRCSPWGML